MGKKQSWIERFEFTEAELARYRDRLKRCPSCQLSQSVIDGFGLFRDRHGVIRIRGGCRTCETRRLKKTAGAWARNNPEKVRAYMRNYYQATKAKWKARKVALRHFPAPQPCSIDNCKSVGERHHEDYDKPLEITWLCKAHHSEVHIQLGTWA